MNRSRLLMLLVALLLLSLSAGLRAQGQNLLNDPSFEFVGDYKVVLADSSQGTVFGVPPAWDGWLLSSPRTEPWMNLTPDGYPHQGLFTFDQSRSLSLSRGFATFTTAIYQRVTVGAGANVRGSARAFMERGNTPPPGAQFRVGIDTAGGANPLAASVVWSAWVTSPNTWLQATVDATATSDIVTLFLYSTQSQPSAPNAVYWDDARLEIGGGGSVNLTPGSNEPAVPTPAFAPFVQPQAARADGSIVHTIQPGDTVDAIAVAYGTTRDAILELNGLRSGAFIFPGQELIVRAAGSGEVAEGTPETTGSPAATANMTTSATGTTATTLIQTATAEPTVAQTETPAASATEGSPQPATETPTETATVTPEPSNTPTDMPPAPVTQVAEVVPTEETVTSLCVWMFNDINQNRIQEDDERLIGDGVIIVRLDGEELRRYTTDGVSEPFCFADLAAGDYAAAAVSPPGYGLTTADVLNLRVQDGVRTNLRFGVAEGLVSAPTPNPLAPTPEATPELLDIAAEGDSLFQLSGLLLFGLAAVILLAGVGLALFVRGR